MKFFLCVFCFIFLNGINLKAKETKDPNFLNPSTRPKVLPKAQRDRKSWSFEKLEDHYKTLNGTDSFYLTHDVLKRARQEKKWDKVQTYAHVFLDQSSSHKNDWNYGNAIFHSHMALSQVAFNKKDMDKARSHLILASSTPGSPQLSSFGPFNSKLDTDYILALFNAGERESLITFADNCRKFVTTEAHPTSTEEEKKNHDIVQEDNIKRLDRFKSQIIKNTAPDFKDE
jgi:hypothetical protein